MKNKKRISLIIAVLTVCVAFASLAIACDKPTPQPVEEKVNVTFVYENGSENDVESIDKGTKITEPEQPEKAGFDFVAWVKQGEDTPFDFDSVINEDITLVATWQATPPSNVRLRWQDDESAKFVFEGNTPRNVAVGTTVSFDVRVSPYYIGTLVVSANDEPLEKDAETGKYSFVVEGATTIKVEGLERDNTPIKGYGSTQSPYVITTASQLKTITDAINEGSSKYIEAVFRLDADIDLNGETITPIGNDKNMFMGKFDGNGHSVSNFVLDSSAGYVGLFGLVATAEIKNLTVNADIVVECLEEQNYIIGGIVAYNIGADVINCAFNGSIEVVSELTPNTYVVYVGGVSGFAQGYSTDYTSTTSYCAVNADISSTGSHEIYCAGGIVGALVGTARSAPAYANNCVFNGKIENKIRRSGGIVGLLRSNTSVANCYTSGSVYAQNLIDVGQYDNVASAGAIAGLAENETAVINCATSASVSFRSAALGDSMVAGSGIIGNKYVAAANNIDDRIAIEYNCVKTADLEDKALPNETLIDVLVREIGWRSTEWQYDENNAIAPKVPNADETSYRVDFVFGKDVTDTGADGNPLTQQIDNVVANVYTPIYWVYGGDGLNTFKADDNTISYGYFFDEERTQRIPSSFLLTSDLTVYVGFEDYSPIAGEYYTVLNSKQVRLEFDDNGMMTMYYDAVIARYMYAFDGNNILIRDGYFAYIAYGEMEHLKNYDLTCDYYARIDDVNGTMSIFDTIFFSSTAETSLGKDIECRKHNDAMGKWYATDGRIYEFLADGTGSISTGDTFSYKCVGSIVNIELGSRTIQATLSQDKQIMRTSDGTTLSVTKFDEFLGKWESSFNDKQEIEIDGRGTLTYKKHAYPYSVNEGVLVCDLGTATFNENGLLVLTKDGKDTLFGKEGSFIGLWRETAYDYWVSFQGIGKDGYGYGNDSNGVSFTYGVGDLGEELGLSISLYYRTSIYGMGSLQTSINGEYIIDFGVRNVSTGALVWDYMLTYVDPFVGDWNGEDGKTISFNGNGAYNIEMHVTGYDWIVKGEVEIADGTNITKAQYAYNIADGTVKYTVGGVEYVATVTKDGISVNGVVYKASDGLDEYDYQSGDLILSFNGKSNVGHGKATLSKNGTETVYDYTFDGSAATLYKNESVEYTATFENGAFTLKDKEGNKVELGLYHALVGKEYIAGSGITIGIDTQFTINGVATGHIGDIEVDVLYISESHVALYYQGELLYYVQYVDENCAGLIDTENNTYIACVPDGLQGTYRSQDGKELTLDGRSKGSKYIYANATLIVEEDIDGEKEIVTHYYTYYVEDEVMYISELDRSGEEDVLVKRYALYLTAQEGAIAFVGEDGETTLYLVEIVG